jgi:hypothetical protein
MARDFLAWVSVAGLLMSVPAPAQNDSVSIVSLPVTISGGHDTDPRDHGRPVVLVAGGLGVPPEVFRDAFGKVHPVTPGSYPDDQRARQNKEVLLAVLAKYGITNRKLDAVSDAYRYQPGSGQLWPTKPAVITAQVRNGEVISYEVIKGGAGYSSQPLLSVPGARSGPVIVKLSFGQNLSSNGSITSVTPLR